jgi:hypothetical protein
MNNELERCGRKRSWPNLRHYSSICLEELGKSRTISQDTRPSGKDLTAGLPNTKQQNQPLGGYGMLVTVKRVGWNPLTRQHFIKAKKTTA